MTFLTIYLLDIGDIILSEKLMNTAAMLIIVSGLPGTGKTTFANTLAAHLKVSHLNSDMIRDELGERGNYDPETKARIYAEMLKRTADLLRKGETVIVDATFHQNQTRKPYLELVKNEGKPLRWIELKAKEAVIRERVSRKRTYSEADFSVYKKIRAAYEPLQIPHLVLSSGQLSAGQMLERAVSYIKEGSL